MIEGRKGYKFVCEKCKGFKLQRIRQPKVTNVSPVKGTTPINLEYPHAECPKCAEPIPDNAVSGDQCEGCDFVFVEPK